MSSFVMDAYFRLKAAGYEVRAASGVPGLYNVEGLADDVTVGQLHDLAARHGREWILPPFPDFRFDLTP